ncbi:MAG: DMT family transporter [Myxococcales bacterium]|nr:DMT family transporter [Myxococcales bacterium]
MSAKQGPPRDGGPILWCILAAAFFGASTPASKALLQVFGPLRLSGILYLGAALAVAPWALRGALALRSAGRSNMLSLAGAVLFGGILGPVLLLRGLSVAPAASVSLWLNLETVATALLAGMFFREHPGPRTWGAVALVVAASALLSPGTGGGLAAVTWVGLACIAWGLDNNLTSIIDRFSPAQVTFAKGIAAGSVNLTLGHWLEPGSTPGAAVAAGLGVGALGYGVSLLLYIAGAQHLGATRSQLIFSTAPAWGLGLSWLVLGEAMRPVEAAAAALMAIAIWLWHREHHTHSHRHHEVTHQHLHRHDDGHHDHEHAEGTAPAEWHSHEHTHAPVEHTHPHRPDLHHRHDH